MINTNIFNTMNNYGRLRLPFFFIVNYDLTDGSVVPLDNIDSNSILFNFNGITNFTKEEKYHIQYFRKFPIDFDDYKIAFNNVLKNIFYGNSYLTNLTFQSKIELNLDLFQIYSTAKAKYKLLFKDKFVCCSPESFVKIIDGEIFSYPMKGTIDSSIPDALDNIMKDVKEESEHYTIVDLIRNDLSIVAKNVEVTKFRYADYITTNQKNLIQISSEIKGRLPDEFHSHLGDIFRELLPAGSVTGAPKKKTIEIINESENYSRGFYTGVFGIYDGNNLDSAVAIRFIEKLHDDLYFKSGGGITNLSNVKSEYQELIDKIYVPVN